MIENNKCILAYGLSNAELKHLNTLMYRVIEIKPEMCEMTVKDILDGIRLNIFNINPIKEKVILYNNFPQNELKVTINLTREYIKEGVIEIITKDSINWKMNYLIKHLIEEREWYLKTGKENRDE